MNTIKKVAILGSTGSIGQQALEIVSSGPYIVHSLLCYGNIELLRKQVNRYKPAVAVAVGLSESTASLSGIDGLLTGSDSVEKACEGADIVLNAIVGSAGLSASLFCAENSIPLALSNKESLVIGGSLLSDAVRQGLIIPVDSEHSTVFRCLKGMKGEPGRILLTASGGALRGKTTEEIQDAGRDVVLAHPTWKMGSRITVDSATMVNKGFEVIEARWLFDMPFEKIDVIIHPESIIHSMVETSDGTYRALLGVPDMKIPIQFALAWPECSISTSATDSPLDWPSLTFKPLDHNMYPAFNLVVQAGRDGGTYPAVVNAADETLVNAFLERRIKFGTIASVIEKVLSSHDPAGAEISLEDILNADEWARRETERILKTVC